MKKNVKLAIFIVYALVVFLLSAVYLYVGVYLLVPKIMEDFEVMPKTKKEVDDIVETLVTLFLLGSLTILLYCLLINDLLSLWKNWKECEQE